MLETLPPPSASPQESAEHYTVRPENIDGLAAATIRLAYPNMADHNRAQNTVERVVTGGIDREQAGTDGWQAAATGLADIARQECNRLDGSRFDINSRNVADFLDASSADGTRITYASGEMVEWVLNHTQPSRKMAENREMLREAGWTSDDRVIVVRQPDSPVRVFAGRSEWSSPHLGATKKYEWTLLEGEVADGEALTSPVMAQRLPSASELQEAAALVHSVASEQAKKS